MELLIQSKFTVLRLILDLYGLLTPHRSTYFYQIHSIINSNLSSFDQFTTNILQSSMNTQQYIYYITPLVNNYPSYADYQALSPYSVGQSPLSFSSTSNQFFFNPSFTTSNYVVSPNWTSMPYNYSKSGEQMKVEHPYHQFKILTQPILHQQVTKYRSPSISQSDGSNCSIKVEESHHLGLIESSYKNGLSSKATNKYEGDKDYNPNKSQRKVVRKRTHQNKNRNVVPNEINQIISFIQKKNKSGHLVTRLFQKFPPQRQSYNINRFYLYQGLLKDKVSHYTTEKSLRLITQLYEPQGRIWETEQQRYYNKLCRLLVRHFLLEDSIFIILTSKRMKSQKKIDHLRARRKIGAKVLEILRG